MVRVLAHGQDHSSAGSSLYVNYSARPDAAEVLKHDFCILDLKAEIDLAPGHALGHQYLAYISTVEVIPETAAMDEARARNVSFITRNTDWRTEVMDITSAGWEDFVIQDLATPAMASGYDGFFLDTLDSIALITAKDPAKAQAAHAALVSLISRLHRQFPGKRIVLNRGFPLLPEVAPFIDGVLLEGLYQSWDIPRKTYVSTKPDGTSWLLAHMQKIRQLHLPVYVVDYVDPQDAALARRTAQRIRSAGAIPFISTPDLQGAALNPTPLMKQETVRAHAQH